MRTNWWAISGSLAQGLMLATVLTLGGCSTIGFYTQAFMGQMSLLSKREPIARVIANPDTPAAVRDKLSLALRIRVFAETLGLPVEDSYAQYVDTGRAYVVWNVFAAPEFSLQPKTFCYPIAGCVSYRGFFTEAAARAFATELESEGDDVFVGGVAAYSTLGWFDDPILNTFITRSDANLAGLLFHELAHKVVYISGDTAFNESFATTVEHEVLKRWLAAQDQEGEYQEYLAREAREDEVIALIGRTRAALASTYNADLSDEGKRAEKGRIIEEMRAAYYEMKSGWGEHAEFKYWMDTDINNAKLGTIATYNDWVSGFTALLAQSGNDIPVFFDAVKALASKEKSARDTTLAELAASAE